MDLKEQLEIQALYARQAVEQTGNPAPTETAGQGAGGADLTREGIAKMAKAAVLELLEAHGVEGATGTVAELRAQLIAIMFVEG